MNEKELQAIKSKEKIMSVAIEEFAINGYKAASTNVISKKANISKGLLYHYYSSKEKLYLAVIRVAIDKFKENVTIKSKSLDKKGIDYISEYFNIKFKFFKENPLYSKLISNILLNNDIEGISILVDEFNDYNNSLIYGVLNTIEINPKFNKQKAYELIIMIGDKLGEKYMNYVEDTKQDNNQIVEKFRQDHKLMIQMVFEGIDK